MFMDAKPQPHRELPGPAGMSGAGLVIGGVSALVAIGGGSLSVPFMAWCNVRIQQAIGTASAIGLPIAISGTIGYTISGWDQSALPGNSIGYIYLPALAGTAIGSVISAPLGVKVAHRMSAAKLKKYLAGVMLLLAAKMLHTLFA